MGKAVLAMQRMDKKDWRPTKLSEYEWVAKMAAFFTYNMLKKVDVSAILGAYDPFFLNTSCDSIYLSLKEGRKENN